MKTRILLPFLLLISWNFLSAQDELIDLVRKGIELHDAGMYREALAEYEKARKIDPRSLLVAYEMGYTYNALGDFKKAVKYADKVLKAGGDFMVEAYLLKANSLDDAGNSKKAETVFRQAIEEYPEEGLLHFNLGVSQYKRSAWDEAETSLENSITLDLGHPGSHYLMGTLQLDQGNRVEGILSLYLFLFLEPDSDRSVDAFSRLWNAIYEGVEMKNDTSYQIKVDSDALESEFSSADLMLSMKAALNLSEGAAAGQTDEAFFAEVTDGFFAVLGEQQTDKEGFWWDTYVDLFAAIQSDGHAEAFAYYVSLSKGEVITQWLEENEEKVSAFSEWLDQYSN